MLVTNEKVGSNDKLHNWSGYHYLIDFNLATCDLDSDSIICELKSRFVSV